MLIYIARLLRKLFQTLKLNTAKVTQYRVARRNVDNFLLSFANKVTRGTYNSVLLIVKLTL